MINLHMLQSKVCGFINAHSGLPQQKTNREISDASKRSLNQATSNRTVWKSGSENQINAHNHL